MKSILDDRISLFTGDITLLTTEAIVNAANNGLLGGGGVDGAIHRAAGSSLLQECRKLRKTSLPKGLPTGQAVLTAAGKLPCQFIIHTVGPVWRGGNFKEEFLLAEAYKNSLILAAQSGIKSISFPSISTGAYGFPPRKAAGIVYRTLKAFTSDSLLPQKIQLVFFQESDYSIFLETINKE